MHTAMEHVSVKVALTHRVFLQGQVYRMPRNVKGIGRTGKKHKKPATGASSGLVGYWGRWRRVPASAGARHLKVRRHLLLRVLRRRASWTRSTPGAPLARPQPPCANRSHPAHPTRRFGTFPPPCIPLVGCIMVRSVRLCKSLKSLRALFLFLALRCHGFCAELRLWRAREHASAGRFEWCMRGFAGGWPEAVKCRRSMPMLLGLLDAASREWWAHQRGLSAGTQIARSPLGRLDFTSLPCTLSDCVRAWLSRRALFE